MAKFLIDLFLDGYDSEKEMEEACAEFIYDNLDFSASAVKVTPITDEQYEKFLENKGV